MFKKETTDKKYHEEIFRAVNFKRDENGNLNCQNKKKFNYMYSRLVRGNKLCRISKNVDIPLDIIARSYPEVFFKGCTEVLNIWKS